MNFKLVKITFLIDILAVEVFGVEAIKLLIMILFIVVSVLKNNKSVTNTEPKVLKNNK